MSKDEFITTSEAADILQVSERTIVEWVRTGYLNGRKVGPGKTSPYRIVRKSVEEKLPKSKK